MLPFWPTPISCLLGNKFLTDLVKPREAMMIGDTHMGPSWSPSTLHFGNTCTLVRHMLGVWIPCLHIIPEGSPSPTMANVVLRRSANAACNQNSHNLRLCWVQAKAHLVPDKASL